MKWRIQTRFKNDFGMFFIKNLDSSELARLSYKGRVHSIELKERISSLNADKITYTGMKITATAQSRQIQNQCQLHLLCKFTELGLMLRTKR